MKTKLTALALTAFTAFSFAPKTAVAGDKEWAAVGGFVGGLIIGSVINDNRHDSYPDRSTTVVINDRDECRGDRDDAGYWELVSVRFWVPGCWVVERSRHGHCYRRYVEGYYDYRTDRVWVSNDRHDRSGRYGANDRRDRNGNYGYGHRR